MPHLPAFHPKTNDKFCKAPESNGDAKRRHYSLQSAILRIYSALRSNPNQEFLKVLQSNTFKNSYVRLLGNCRTAVASQPKKELRREAPQFFLGF
ncbi:hypothetical protein HCU40_15245 [Pseudanabaena biceps]|nr:hypothetical protein [Pseudanabaena biceps]